MALEKLKEDRLKAEGLAEKKSSLEKEINSLEGEISAYQAVSHDTVIEENDPLKELKQKIKEHKAKIEANKEIDFEKVKKEYNNFFEEEKPKIERLAENLPKEWEKYEEENTSIKKMKEIQDGLKEFENSADLLLKAQNTKLKYEKIKKSYIKAKELIEKNGKKEFEETFKEEKSNLVKFLEGVLKNRNEVYKKFTSCFRKDDKDEIGEDMVDLEKAIGFIKSYDFNASEESCKKLSKYKEGISEQLKHKDKKKEYGELTWVRDKYLDQNARLDCKYAKYDSPLMKVGGEMKKDIVEILEIISKYLEKMINCQENSKKAAGYMGKFKALTKLEDLLKKESEALRKDCEEKNLKWETFKERVDAAKNKFKSEESKLNKKMVKDSGLDEYFAQFKKIGEIDKQISIKEVAGKIKYLDDEVQKLKPKKTKEELEQEIKERDSILREEFNEARELQKAAKKSEDELQKGLKESEELKLRKVDELDKLGKQDLHKLEQKEEELSEKSYKFNINPMKYYNEVNELLAD